MKVGLCMLRPWTELPISQPAAGLYSAAGGLHSTTSLRKRTGPRTQVPRTQGSKADGIDDWMVMVNCCLMIQWEGKLAALAALAHFNGASGNYQHSTILLPATRSSLQTFWSFIYFKVNLSSSSYQWCLAGMDAAQKTKEVILKERWWAQPSPKGCTEARLSTQTGLPHWSRSPGGTHIRPG